MTAGNNGTPEPGTDDPFAYLYRQEGAEAGQTAAAPAGQPGVPRTSYNQVRAVGERRPAPPQQQQQPSYGYPPQQQPPQYGTQPLPEQPSRSGGHGGHSGGPGRGSGGGPNNKGLLIGAVAVVAAVAIGIGVAMANGSDNTNTGANSSPSASTGTTSGSNGSSEPSASASSSTDANAGLPGVTDVSTLALAGGAAASTEHAGAYAAGGKYVDHMGSVGASVTWTVDVPKAGQYTLFVRYGNAGADANATMSINGEKQSNTLSLKNWTHESDWAKAWTNSFAWIPLTKGSNTIAISCEQGNQCAFNLDQVQLKAGQVRSRS
ncbi:MAG: hypothetical protein QOF84_3496 [Streptomyces sp.]|nr:hypothetical protein [Streptomyces sp.]